MTKSMTPSLSFQQDFKKDSRWASFVRYYTAKKWNLIGHVLEIIMIVYSFIALCIGASKVEQVVHHDHSFEKMILFSGLTVLSILYVYELIADTRKVGWPLVIHHFISLVFMQVITAPLFFNGTGIEFVRMGIFLTFTAILERITFLVLILLLVFHHVTVSTVKKYFSIAYIQLVIVKTSCILACLNYYMWKNQQVENVLAVFYSAFTLSWDDDDKFWYIVYIPLYLALFSSQLYSVKIMYDLFRNNHGLEPNNNNYFMNAAIEFGADDNEKVLLIENLLEVEEGKLS